MPETRDIGRLYVHRYRHPVDRAPRITPAKTVEVEDPYRIGRGLVLRWGRRAGVCIGWWGKAGRQEAEALYDALGARDLREASPIAVDEDWLGEEEEWPIATV